MGAKSKDIRSCMYCGASGELNKDIFQGPKFWVKIKQRVLGIDGKFVSEEGVERIGVCRECIAKALENCAKGLRKDLSEDQFGQI